MSCYFAYILDNTADKERVIEDIAAKGCLSLISYHYMTGNMALKTDCNSLRIPTML